MKVKVIRTHYEPNKDELGLENTLNEIGIENVKMVLPTYYGNGEVAYTIIYKDESSIGISL